MIFCREPFAFRGLGVRRIPPVEGYFAWRYKLD